MVVLYKFSQMRLMLLLSLIPAMTILAALIKRDCNSGESCNILGLQPGGAKCCGVEIVTCGNNMVLHAQECGPGEECIGHGFSGARCEAGCCGG